MFLFVSKWIKCPVCGNKIREDTVIKNFPSFCPQCKKEGLIDVESLTIKVLNQLHGSTNIFIKSVNRQRNRYVL